MKIQEKLAASFLLRQLTDKRGRAIDKYTDSPVNFYKNISIIPEAMEDIVKSIESLMESAADYGQTSYDLVKLRTIYKTSDMVSTLIPHAVVFIILMSFLLFLNLGVAFWLSKIFGNMFYGFFVVAAFYGIIGIVVHFFMHNRIKMKISDYIIKQALK